MNHFTGQSGPLTGTGLSASQYTFDQAKRLMRHYLRQAKHFAACSPEGKQLLRKMLNLAKTYSL